MMMCRCEGRWWCAHGRRGEVGGGGGQRCGCRPEDEPPTLLQCPSATDDDRHDHQSRYLEIQPEEEEEEQRGLARVAVVVVVVPSSSSVADPPSVQQEGSAAGRVCESSTFLEWRRLRGWEGGKGEKEGG